MSFLNKTYSFVSQENFDKYLLSVGIPEDKVEKLQHYAPSQKLVKDGDTYTYINTSPQGTKEVKFKPGVEFDDVIGAENVPIKSTYTVDGNTVTQVVTAPQGTATFKKEYNGDDLVVTITGDKFDGVARRWYKA